MRVVLDTNIVVSAYLWVGSAGKVFDIIEQRKVRIYTCMEQLLEIENVLKRPKFYNAIKSIGSTYQQIVHDFAERSHVMVAIPRLEIIKADPPDNIILGCAIAANADYLVTGDTKHLLPVKKIGIAEIISPSNFIKLFS